MTQFFTRILRAIFTNPPELIVKYPASWSWAGIQWTHFRFGQGDAPIKALLATKTKDMEWNSQVGWVELQKTPLFLCRFEYTKGSEQIVYMVFMDRTKKEHFIWGFSDGHYSKNQDGHPHPTSGYFWADTSKITKLINSMQGKEEYMADVKVILKNENIQEIKNGEITLHVFTDEQDGK